MPSKPSSFSVPQNRATPTKTRSELLTPSALFTSQAEWRKQRRRAVGVPGKPQRRIVDVTEAARRAEVEQLLRLEEREVLAVHLEGVGALPDPSRAERALASPAGED